MESARELNGVRVALPIDGIDAAPCDPTGELRERGAPQTNEATTPHRREHVTHGRTQNNEIRDSSAGRLPHGSFHPAQSIHV